MLLNFLSKYLSEVEVTVRKLEGAYVERYEEEIVAVNRVNLRIRVRFQNGHMLELNEAIIGEAGRPSCLGYRYHFQDEKNNLIFGSIRVSQRVKWLKSQTVFLLMIFSGACLRQRPKACVTACTAIRTLDEVLEIMI